MMNAYSLIAQFATENINTRPIHQQLAIYGALAEIMPNKSERQTASRIAWMLKEAAALQLEFTNALFADPSKTKP